MSGSPLPPLLLVDTGPLLALVNRRDRHHAWISDLLSGYKGRLATCEAVLSEGWFLSQSRLAPPDQFLALVERLPLEVMPAWGGRTLDLLRKYADRPMALADACLLVLAEQERDSAIVTTDRTDFSVYRLRDRDNVPTLMPD